jgi:hypothetical protein
MGGEVTAKNGEGVYVAELFLFDNDSVSFEEAVSFVRR